ncbi:MAG TPA: lysylphosphatidylglycerol synthase domain-containing protein [Tepidisphaeraceae bacterium]|jgi:hypothetical protein
MTDLAPEPIAIPAPPRKRRLVNLIKLALLLLVLALVGRVLFKQWQQIAANDIPVQVRPLPLVGAALLLMSVALIQAVSYRTLLGAYATAPLWRAMPTIAWVPPMGKYIPGGAVIAAVAMLRKLNIPVGVAVAVVLVQDGLAQLAGLIVSAPLLWWQPVMERVPWARFVAVPAILAAAVCLWPAVFAFGVNTLLGLLKRPPLPRMPSMKQYAVPMACAFGQWVLHGAALGFIVQSVTGQSPWPHFLLLMSFAALSQTLGYLAVFAPGGLGVREAVLLACLTPLPGVGPLAAVIVPIRAVAQVIVDLTMGAIGLSVIWSTRADRDFDETPRQPVA